jgi:carboxypeptidase C (cathepsin A)
LFCGARREPSGREGFVELVMRLHRIAVLALALTTAAAPALAQQPDRGNRPDQQQQQRQPRHDEQPSGKGVLRLLPGDSFTEHTLQTAEGALNYTATAGIIPLYGQSGDEIAGVFHTAYVAKNPAGPRPLSFAFNGGPGAASAFLNLGLLGPRRLDFGSDGRSASEAKLTDNPDSWLRFTDLVFVDPIGTGWSRTVKGDDAKDFWGVARDADSIAKVISLYVAKNNRAAGPIYLIGESYGGFRAAKVARALQRDYGIAVSGIVMLSPLLEAWLTFGDDQSALRAALALPSLAAANLAAENKLTPEALAQAEKFALTDYLLGLAGPPLTGDVAQAFYKRVADITGLPLDAVSKARGFVTDSFLKTLRNGKVVSRYDADFAVDDPFPEERAAHGPDPILDGLARAYGGAFANYARNELGYQTEVTYKLLAGDVTGHWDWGHGGRGQAGIDSDLRVLLSFDPHFRLLIAHGMTDMVTPYADSRYVLDHLPPANPLGRTQLKLYRGGHMFYLNAQARRAFSNDAGTFYKAGP